MQTVGTHSGNVKTMASFDEAVNLVKQLDHAVEIPLFYKLPDHLVQDGKPYEVQLGNGKIKLVEPGYHAAPHNKGVLNLATGTLAAVTGKEYSVLQHGDALGVSLNVINGLGTKALYAVENDRNVARLEVMFPEITIHDDSADGIALGVRLSNSYDKTTGFNGEFYGFRQVCANGMYSRKLLGEINISARHVGDNFQSLTELVTNFVKRVLDSPKVVEDMIAQAISQKLEFTDNEQVYNTIWDITRNIKQTEKIVERIPLKTDRWTVFNAFTHYASHADVTHKTRDDLSLKAEKILMTTITPAQKKVVAAQVA